MNDQECAKSLRVQNDYRHEHLERVVAVGINFRGIVTTLALRVGLALACF